MKENIPVTIRKERVYTPRGKWVEVCNRISKLGQIADPLSDSLRLLPETNHRRIEVVEAFEKIIELRQAAYEHCESSIDPDPEVYEDLDQVEKEIKKFVN